MFFFPHSWSSTSVLTSLISFLLRDFLIVQQWLWWWQWMMTMSACLVHTCVCDFLQEREGKEILSLLQYQLYSQRTQDLCKKHLIVIWLERKSRIPHQLATFLMTYRRHTWQSTKCPAHLWKKVIKLLDIACHTTDAKFTVLWCFVPDMWYFWMILKFSVLSGTFRTFFYEIRWTNHQINRKPTS